MQIYIKLGLVILLISVAIGASAGYLGYVEGMSVSIEGSATASPDIQPVSDVTETKLSGTYEITESKRCITDCSAYCSQTNSFFYKTYINVQKECICQCTTGKPLFG